MVRPAMLAPWRALPLQQKNRSRASAGAGGLVACLVLAAHGFPVVGSKLTTGIAALALLYLIVGIVGTVRAERLTFDLMAVFWRCALGSARRPSLSTRSSGACDAD